MPPPWPRPCSSSFTGRATSKRSVFLLRCTTLCVGGRGERELSVASTLKHTATGGTLGDVIATTSCCVVRRAESKEIPIQFPPRLCLRTNGGLIGLGILPAGEKLPARPPSPRGSRGPLNGKQKKLLQCFASQNLSSFQIFFCKLLQILKLRPDSN